MIRVALVLVALWLAAATYLFVLRDGDDPIEPADAVVVLSGSPERLPVGLRLVREGASALLVVSKSHEPNALERRTCADPHVLCFAARPYSTRGEARAIARLARERKWVRIDVVTSRFHVFRAKRMIERCYGFHVRVVAAPNPRLPRLALNYVLESAKIALHEVDRGC